MILNDAAQFLIIESDPTKLKSLASVARFVGAGNVVACQSTKEAEIAMGKNSFSFILCRDQLKPEGGCQFISRMRGQEMKTPVVFVSTSRAAQNVLAAADIDHAEFLTMPFSLADLRECIHRLTVA